MVATVIVVLQQAGQGQRGQRDHRGTEVAGGVDQPAAVHDTQPGQHGGHAEPEVGHHVEQRDQAGPLVGRGQRDYRADPALETAAEADAGDRGPGEEHGRGSQAHGQDGYGHAGDQGHDADQHDRPGGGPAQRDDRDDGRAGQHEQAQGTQHHVGRAGQRVHQRRAERAVQAGQRPHREQHGHGGQHRPSQPPRHGDLRPQAGQRARCPADGLAHRGDRGRLERQHADQDQVDEVGGVGQEADRQRGDDRAGGGAHARRHRVGEGAELSVHVQHGRADRAQGGAGGQALDHPGGEQLGHPGGGGEDDQRARVHGQRGQQHRPPPHVVGQLAEGQQRGQHRQRVDPEHDRGGDRREVPLSLVDRIERGGGGRGGQQRHDQRGQHEDGRAPAQPTASQPGLTRERVSGKGRGDPGGRAADRQDRERRHPFGLIHLWFTHSH
jgi:hypothetical protein